MTADPGHPSAPCAYCGTGGVEHAYQSHPYVAPARPTGRLRQRLVQATWGGRDAHGSIPFDQKDAWMKGYDEARRQLLDALARIEADEASDHDG